MSRRADGICPAVYRSASLAIVPARAGSQLRKAAGSEGQRHERAGGLDRIPALGQPAGKLLDGALDHAMHDFLRVHLGRARPIPGKPLPMGARLA